ncbi:phosphomethylpyrimidine synthase ThiC [Desulfoplanes formicivorans]|uniref:Phosphomethylpyrimidine synthase n=1 Tax=Desulfoplanes formicivorans TaxID=1592317 RepID=A0A194AIR4_9BACT|nr:phosphomethylpyrimidine synthase ThiC [Desulfoplanes formicivorans]GAU09218.1 phosphomethylpyrimidine synthase [Desulfoplanes formicivorans]
MSFTTQMDAARKGIVTPQMQTVAAKEKVPMEDLMDRMARGSVIIPANKNHASLQGEGVGEGLRIKVNVNLGISKDCQDMEAELDKVRTALSMHIEAIMDLSCYGKTAPFRKRLVDMSPVMIGTVPVYDAVGFCDKNLRDITVDDWFRVVEQHVVDGVDFLTIHAGLNRATAEKIKKQQRITNIVSRGGALLFSWMELNDAENPFFQHYDRLLDLCEQHDVTLSLGDGCRPGCLHDATDASQVQELISLGELTKRAWERNVQVMIEGPGHMAMNEIPGNMMLEKRLCFGAPFYVLGPLVTDVAPGYDHITAAIGGAIAAQHGADFLCYVTPAEHLRLPSLDDLKEGIMATRIAAHAADIGRGIPGARAWDDAMAKARADLDWETMFQLAMDDKRAREYRKSSMPEHQDSCSMCGKMCAVRNMNRILAGKDIQLDD